MAFIAHVDMLIHNSNNKPGGGPFTLNCSACHKPFNEGDLIEGPSRNRNHETPYTPARGYGYKLRYWHANCSRPQPYNVNANTTNNTPIERAPSLNNGDGAYVPSNTDDTINAIMEQITAVGENNKAAIEQTANAVVRLGERVTSVESTTASLATLIGSVSDNVMAIDNTTSDLANRVSAIEAAQPKIVSVSFNNGEVKQTNVGATHCRFDDLIELVTTLDLKDRNVWLYGPSGSGKSFTCEQVAEAFDLPFYQYGTMLNAYELTGYEDANGRPVRTPMYYAWTDGGVLLFDEFTSSNPGAVLALNNALSNGLMHFKGDKFPTKRHENTIVLVGDNTWGFGQQNTNLVARNKLDVTSLSRFRKFLFDIDPELEAKLTPNQDWLNVIREVRRQAALANNDITITPRDAIIGAQLLNKGMSKVKVVSYVFECFRSMPWWPTIGAAAEQFANS